MVQFCPGAIKSTCHFIGSTSLKNYFLGKISYQCMPIHIFSTLVELNHKSKLSFSSYGRKRGKSAIKSTFTKKYRYFFYFRIYLFQKQGLVANIHMHGLIQNLGPTIDPKYAN